MSGDLVKVGEGEGVSVVGMMPGIVADGESVFVGVRVGVTEGVWLGVPVGTWAKT